MPKEVDLSAVVWLLDDYGFNTSVPEDHKNTIFAENDKWFIILWYNEPHKVIAAVSFKAAERDTVLTTITRVLEMLNESDTDEMALVCCHDKRINSLSVGNLNSHNYTFEELSLALESMCDERLIKYGITEHDALFSGLDFDDDLALMAYAEKSILKDKKFVESYCEKNNLDVFETVQKYSKLCSESAKRNKHLVDEFQQAAEALRVLAM